MATPPTRNALAAAYEAAEKLRTPDSALNTLDLIDLLDFYSRRNPLTLSALESGFLKRLLHDNPQPGFVYVEHLMDAALAGERVLHGVSHA